MAGDRSLAPLTERALRLMLRDTSASTQVNPVPGCSLVVALDHSTFQEGASGGQVGRAIYFFVRFESGTGPVARGCPARSSAVTSAHPHQPYRGGRSPGRGPFRGI